MRSGSILHQVSDAELAALAVSGDATAFDQIVRRHGAALRGLLRRMGAQPALADDIAQDAFVAAYQNIAAFRGEAGLAPWLKRIAARLYIRRWRSESRYQLTETPQDDTPFEADGLSDERLDLDEALSRLSQAERMCVSLCTGCGFSHPEAADLLRIPAGTVKSHVKRGLDKLRRIMAPQGVQPARSAADA